MTEEPCIIVSADKDLDMIPGWHYNFVRQEKYFIREHEGLANFYIQLILGDSSDNIPGYDGKMRPKVPKFLAPTLAAIRDAEYERDMYDVVLRMYSGEEDRVLRNGRLLWIRRKEGEMWELPK